jgi:protein gp37
MATLISSTNETWNPTTGCSRVSDGCRNCYAESLSLRFGWSKKPWTAVNAKENVKLHPDRLRKPHSWKKPSKVFIDSMSDLFHELIPDDFIAQVFAVMGDTPRHTYQILTKRAERAAEWSGRCASRKGRAPAASRFSSSRILDHAPKCVRGLSKRTERNSSGISILETWKSRLE